MIRKKCSKIDSAQFNNIAKYLVLIYSNGVIDYINQQNKTCVSAPSHKTGGKQNMSIKLSCIALDISKTLEGAKLLV